MKKSWVCVWEKEILAGALEQLGVAAPLHDAPIAHDDDLVGVLNSAQAVGNTFSLRSTPTGSEYRNATNYSIQYYYQNVAGENSVNTAGIVKTLTGNGFGGTSFLKGGGKE